MAMRINVGCGMTPTKDWVNFDNSFSLRLATGGYLGVLVGALPLLTSPQRSFISFARDAGIRYGDATTGLPLPPASVEVLYSSHMLEHLDREEARTFLAEARRLLASGGILRLAVPDIRMLVEKYLATGDSDAFIDKTLLSETKPKGIFAKLKYILFTGFRHHHWMYDSVSLPKLLIEAGFRDPIVLPPGETTISDPGLLDLRERWDESLYVEARNP
jgi:SAM-dependent methyltransferase